MGGPELSVSGDVVRECLIPEHCHSSPERMLSSLSSVLCLMLLQSDTLIPFLRVYQLGTFPGSPAVKTSVLPLQGSGFPSLVEELRSHVP